MMFRVRCDALLVLALFFLGATRTTAAAEAEVCVNGDDCTTSGEQQQQHNSKSWFEDAASNDGVKFLKENVFGQKAAKQSKNKDHAERGNSFSLLFDRLADGSSIASSADEKEDSDDGSQKSSKGSKDDGKDSGILSSLADIASSDDPSTALWEFFLDQSADAQNDVEGYQDMAKLFMEHAQEVLDQLKRVVGDKTKELMDESFYLPSAWYLLRYEQTKKHAYWKSEQHKFMPKLTDVAYFRELHLGLYLSDLAYVDDEAQVREGLKKVDDDSWELLYVDTQGNPSEPAHFLAIEKQAASLQKPKHKKNDASGSDKKKGWWQNLGGGSKQGKQQEDTLKVMIVIRGTKTMGDILSDGLLEATAYREKYKAHGGIQKSGSYIVEKHIGRLKQLLEVSGRSKIQLLLFGHSLGCGTAAIAAMEFHDNYKDFLTVKAVGFGCPSLVSPELSEQYKDIITTVISDSDCVPRLAGASIVNLHLAMISLDWTDYMLKELRALAADVIKDIHEWTNGQGTKFATDICNKMGEAIKEYLTQTVKPTIVKAVEEDIPRIMSGQDGISTKEARRGLQQNSYLTLEDDQHDLDYRMETELIPPGTCLHLYRTATGFEAAYTPCTFFDEIEYVPSMVADHLTESGYHLALLTLLRQQTNNHNAVFDEELFR